MLQVDEVPRPLLEHPGYRWSVQVDEDHIEVVIQHNAVGFGPLRLWMAGWSCEVHLHLFEDDEGACEAAVANAVRQVHRQWQACLAERAMERGARELSQAGVGLLMGSDPDSGPMMTLRKPAGALRAQRRRRRGVSLAATAIAVPAAALHVLNEAIDRTGYARCSLAEWLSCAIADVSTRRDHTTF